MKENNEQLPFEKAIERLEEVVEQLEDGDVPLEKAIELFREGTLLAGYCREKLNWAEQQVEMLVKESNGWSKKPFATEEEAE